MKSKKRKRHDIDGYGRRKYEMKCWIVEWVWYDTYTAKHLLDLRGVTSSSFFETRSPNSTNSHFTAHVGSRYSSDPTWLTSSLSSKPLKTLPIASSFQVLLKDLITFDIIFISLPFSLLRSISRLRIYIMLLFRDFSLIQLYFHVLFLLCDNTNHYFNCYTK